MRGRNKTHFFWKWFVLMHINIGQYYDYYAQSAPRFPPDQHQHVTPAIISFLLQAPQSRPGTANQQMMPHADILQSCVYSLASFFESRIEQGVERNLTGFFFFLFFFSVFSNKQLDYDSRVTSVCEGFTGGAVLQK